jgi:hypothetical protein
VISAVEGFYGDYHLTARTEGSTLWINPLMALYWCFRLPAVARRVLYLEEVRATERYEELTIAVNRFRGRSPARDFFEIPL